MMARLFGVRSIAADAVEALDRTHAFVVDTNPPWAWEVARVPGAHNLDPGDYTAADLPADKSTLLVFYCSNPLCPAAPYAAQRAQRLGYSDVAVMSEGILGWLARRKAVERGKHSA